MGENITDKTVLFETETEQGTGRKKVKDTPENKIRASETLENFKKNIWIKVSDDILFIMCDGGRNSRILEISGKNNWL